MIRTSLLAVLLLAPDAAAQPKLDRHGDPLPDGAVMRLGTVRQRASVTGFGVLADGTVVTVGQKGEVREWAQDEDTSSLPIPLILPGPQAHGYPQVSPDGSRVAVHSANKVVVYERPAGVLKKLAEFDIDRTRRMVFSPDGKTLFVAWEEDRHYRYSACDVATGKETDLDGVREYPETMAVSGDGKRLAVGLDYRAVAWDAATGKVAFDFKTGRTRIAHLALDHTGEVAAVTAVWEPSTVKFFTTKDGAAAPGLTGPNQHGWVTFAADGKSILVGGAHGVLWWDAVAGKLIRKFEGATAQRGIFSTPGRFTPDGKTLVAYTEQAILRWDAATGKPLHKSQDAGHGDAVYSVGLSPDGKTFATAGMDSRVRTWDAATGEPRHAFESMWTTKWDVTFSPDSRHLYGHGVGWGGPMKWDVASGKALFRFEFDPAEPKQSYADTLRPSPDGRTLTGTSRAHSANGPGMVTVWDADTGKRVSSTRRPVRSSDELMFGLGESPDGRWYSTSHAVALVGSPPDDNVLPAEVTEKISTLVPGRFSPDSRLVVVSGIDFKAPEDRRQHAVVCELATGSVVRDVIGAWAAFSPDGRTLAVAEATDITLRDIGTGRELRRFVDPGAGALGNRAANSLVFVAGGTKLMTGHQNTTALVWAVPPRPKADALDDAARTAAWDALAGADASKAWAAIGVLADDAGAAAFLKAKLKPVNLPKGKLPPGDAVRVVRAIAALEQRGTADAKALLADHATGPGGTTAAEAKRALDRMR
jgi:WD40 repeat protein